jgi:RND family efflux transporter MFP subunit
VLLMGALASLPVRAEDEKAAAAPIPPRDGLQAFAVKRGNLIIKQEWAGTVQAADRVDISAATGLMVQKIAVSEGQTVKKDDPLIIVDKQEMQNKNKEMRIAFEMQKLDYKNVELDFQQKKNEYLIKKELFEKNIIARAAFSQVESAYQVASNTLRSKEIDLRKQEEQLKTMEANMGNFDYLAPMDGTVSGLITLQQGQKYVSERTKLASISRLDRFMLRIEMEDAFVHRTSVGAAAIIKLNNFPDKTFSGKVEKVGIQALGEASGGVNKYEVLIALDADPALADQLSGSAEITFASKENVLTIPLGVLSEIGGETMVLSSTDGESPIVQKTITLGLKSDLEVEITAGLDEGVLVYKEFIDR